MIASNPTEITLANLEVIVMPNGEIICSGKSLGFVKEFDKYLSEKIKDTKSLELAEAQLLGYTHGRDGYSLESLISSMALKQDEWDKLQEMFGMAYLTKDDREEIENYLDQE